MADITPISAAMSAVGSTAQAFYNHYEAKKAYERTLSLQRQAQAFNSREAAIQRYYSSPEYLASQYQKIGLNKDLMYGNGASLGSMSAATSPAGGAVSPASGVFSDLGSVTASSLNNDKLVDSIVKKNLADAQKAKSDSDLSQSTIKMQSLLGDKLVAEKDFTEQQIKESEARVKQMETTLQRFYNAQESFYYRQGDYIAAKNLREKGIYLLDREQKDFIVQHQRELYNYTLKEMKSRIADYNASARSKNTNASYVQKEVDYYTEEFCRRIVDTLISAASTGRFDLSDLSFNVNGDAGDGVLRFERTTGKGDVTFDGTIRDNELFQDILGVLGTGTSVFTEYLRYKQFDEYLKTKGAKGRVPSIRHARK